MHKVERAIIMAAGRGSRLNPLTLTTPKPLIKVNGKPMIENVIESLQENGIKDIYIVIGYLSEKFYYLKDKYDSINFIKNIIYDKANNISSLYLARNYIGNSIILDGDQLIYNKEILRPEFEKSGYNCVWTNLETKEWLLNVENNVVKSCSRNGGKNGWQLYSVSRWTKKDGELLKRHLEIEFEQKKNFQLFWDDVPLFCYPHEYDLGIFKMQKGDIVEIDTLEELKQIDSSYNN